MTSILTGLLGTLIGLFLGNRFALGRDRRKEFNEIVSPLFDNLEKQRLTLVNGDFPNAANHLNASSFITLIRVTPNYKRKRLNKAIDNYQKAKHSCGHHENGIYVFDKPELLRLAIEQLQVFMPHK